MTQTIIKVKELVKKFLCLGISNSYTLLIVQTDICLWVSAWDKFKTESSRVF